MERRSIAHIAVLASIVACAGLLEGTAWSKTAPAKAPAAARSYVVKSGDGGWWQIAHAHGTTLPHLLAANHATAATPVSVGQKIKLPADAHVDAKSAHPAQAPAQAKHAPAAATTKPKPH